ncbi:MAG: response regulator [Acidobacteria bacterium]|jgi:CheY-like chemotaxis protein|nr:response regulator [Acidobacteriota bacterium]
MKKEVTILIAEDDMGHAALIRKNIVRAGITNAILHFKDGQELLDFFFKKDDAPHRVGEISYLLLLDIRMPKVDGVEVLRVIKGDPELRKIPTIILTTTDDPREVENCHQLGCSSYITKPVDYEKFVDVIKKLGFFLMVVEVPGINGYSINE